ncbi:MAG: cadmium-translocating P-type ATPase, partial [Firmicutes bacterium]|nr:cadmium-translocating P-type ATPase [Bacillota bacterium]
LVILGGPIIVEALKGIMRKELNVDELVSLAIIASAVIGEYLPAAIVALIMVLGSLLEEYTAQKARSAIDSLIQLAPDEAIVMRGNKEVAIPVKEIRVGDRLLIRTGNKVPIDGRVIRGEALLNQASLTGESDPVEKAVEDSVYAGTVIYSGMLEVEATKVGEDTTLGKLIELVQEAEKQKAPAVRLVDRYARYFTPVIIALGLIVFLITKDIYRAITVLIVGCPCAFILASPTAVVSALGNASRNGVLIKGGDVLEKAAGIDAVLFDKTGTLTSGKPTVSAIKPLDKSTPEEILAAAAAVEQYSTHPLARAILEAAAQKKIPLAASSHYKNIPGKGVEAVVGGKKYTVGKMERELQLKLQSAAPSNETSNHKAVALWEDEAPRGLIFFEEEMRPGHRRLVGGLAEVGISKVQMLTGDEQKAAAPIAEQMGIEEYLTGVTPAEKLEQVKELQQKGYQVAMVGDGVNDAPSLAAADIGISMGAMGTDAALEAANVALMGDDITKIPYFLKLGKATVRTIKFNITFAMIFNILALAASGAGWLSPVTGAVAHNIGSVIVVVNSARLIARPLHNDRAGLSLAPPSAGPQKLPDAALDSSPR